MKKQLLLVSAILGLTTASFASNMEEGSKLQTYGSISSVLKVLSESKPAEAVPNGNVFNKFAADIGVSSEEGKKALYGALVGESDIKSQLSAEMAEGFDQEKEKAGNALVKMFVDSMNARKVSAIGKLNTLLEKYVGEEIIDPNTDLSKIEISALVDGKIEAVLNGIDVAINPDMLGDFKDGLHDVLASVKADLLAVKAFNTNSIKNIFDTYDAASQNIFEQAMNSEKAKIENQIESRVKLEVEKRSNAGMSRSELKSRVDEEFESEEEIKQPIKFTSNKVEQTKEEVSVPTKHTKPEHTQPAKEEEKKAYNLANLSEFKVIDSKKSGMSRANYLKGKDALKAEYDAWVKDGKPQS